MPFLFDPLAGISIVRATRNANNNLQLISVSCFLCAESDLSVFAHIKAEINWFFQPPLSHASSKHMHHPCISIPKRVHSSKKLTMPSPRPPTRHIPWGKWDHLHALAAQIQRHILIMPVDCMLESFQGFDCKDAARSGVSSSAGHSAGYSLLKNCFDTQKATAACLSQFSQMETICLSFLVCLLFWHCCQYGVFVTGERRHRVDHTHRPAAKALLFATCLTKSVRSKPTACD